MKRANEDILKKATASWVVVWLTGISSGALAGIFIGLLFSAINRWDRPVLLGMLGGIFGTLIGGVVGLLKQSMSVRSHAKTRIRQLVLWAFCGAIVGAGLFVLFAEGLSMAIYLAIEGTLFGMLIGVTASTITQFVAGYLKKPL